MAHHPRKRFGQHWLRSEAVLQRIVDAANLQPGDRLLEIGPGKGVLTRRLSEQAASVVAVEVDRDLCADLRQEFHSSPTIHVIEGDVLSFDLTELHAVGVDTGDSVDAGDSQPLNKVVANIPYYITGPILEKLLGAIAQPNPQPFEAIVLLVQREVAERVCAEATSKTFGALSVRVQYLAETEYVCTVPSKAFFPAPKVESAVIKLKPRPFEPQAIAPSSMETLVKVGFSTKRKMLRNNLKSLVERDRLMAAFDTLGIKHEARAEEISTLNWVKLSNLLYGIS
ncbi:MAG: 16S rRNA (adenine(1518)-N(6)/adenine(1519)-N(6))-dimethyltransferase RsmA [Leptolyngbyaceae bacterium]|nr:16S rRNA (adenine(1518)-N(6)/adenine(1519)-N(6))-dimethyltransferase RsmA [Leptolyngbyaceae bacterium]